jgi:NADH-quinone oxidoreductase subunit H
VRKKYILGIVVPGIMLGAIAVTIWLFAFFRLGWFRQFLPDTWPAGLVTFIELAGSAVIVSLIGALPIVFLTWLERKVVARIQDRIGPNVAGPWGMIIAIADAIKMFTKEDTTPAGADSGMYNAAPIMMAAASFMIFAVLPFAPGLVGADLSVALLYVLALGSVSTVAVLTAGWGSNNKYALLGAFRTVAQLIAYEIPQALGLIAPIMLAGSMSTLGIIEAQDVAYIFVLPVSAFIFLVAGIAETARTPFDLLEAESEIVAGFHVEYSGMKFALFFLAEYANMFAVSMLTAVVFLGGYRFFGLEEAVPFLAPLIMIGKAMLVVFVFMWIRGTLPRFRIDQMLDFSWKFLVPLSLVNLIVVAILAKLLEDAALGLQVVVLLAANLLMVVGVYVILTIRGRRLRQADATLRAVMEAESEPAVAH